MADELDRPGETPEHEDAEAHLPAPTIWPFAFAGAVALILLGLIVSPWATALGIVLAVVFGFLWIRQVTREVRARAGARRGSLSPLVAEPAEEEGEEGPARYERSKFLEGATIGIGVAIGAIVTLPVLGFAVAPAFVGQEFPDVDLGPLDNYPEGQWQIATFTSNVEDGNGLAAHGVRPQQRAQGQRPELLHPLEPLRAPRLPDAASGPARRAARDRDDERPGRADADAAVRLRLPLPRRRLRRRGQPDGGPAGARARPLRVLDHRGQSLCSGSPTASPRSRARAPTR